MPDEPISAQEWKRRSLEKLKSAKVLQAKNMWQDAYDLAGQAVELALKHKIMTTKGWNGWPDLSPETRYLYVHDLAALADVAGLQGSLERMIENADALGRAWMVAKQWKRGVGYPMGLFPSRQCRDMIRALEDEGLLRWLLT